MSRRRPTHQQAQRAHARLTSKPRPGDLDLIEQALWHALPDPDDPEPVSEVDRAALIAEVCADLRLILDRLTPPQSELHALLDAI